ncbi:MAG: hypothetical protein R3B53_03905 [Candidatus Paceibacterota bacterium]
MTEITNVSNVVFLNVWGHRHHKLLERYIKEKMTAGVDIFCFTEVTHTKVRYKTIPRVYMGLSRGEPPASINGLEQLINLMSKDYYLVYDSPENKKWTCRKTGTEFPSVGFGSAMIYQLELKVIATKRAFICKKIPGVNHRVMQWIVYEKGGIRYLVAHLHGVWIAHNTKGDDHARDRQSHEIRENLRRLADKYSVDKVVFGGDLNLAIDTDALAALTREGGNQVLSRNLVVEGQIESTRTRHYREYGKPNKSQHADYVLTSSGVLVHDFQVENEKLASDHAPLVISFS